ncbi:MAG TPA: hypothetical protein VN787_07905 [Steroidobacteraceae bacterium]|nr:hypothetical protein [Steroidobacteraceae bacterium]
MNARARAWIRGLSLAVLAIAYAVLAHLSNSTPGASGLGVALAAGPLLVFAVILAWRSTVRLPALLLCALASLLTYRYWPLLAQHFPWLYLLQQVSVYGLLALMFGRSLAAQRVPLCTHWATRVHGPLSPAVARYTRAVTVVWTAFFALITLTLVVLFALAPLPVWSAFANFCAFPLIITLFVVEYAVRNRVLPNMRHAGILAGARAFLTSERDTAAARRG